MDKKPTYHGKINNAGMQFVEAPIKNNVTPQNKVISTGKDLRANSGKTK